MARTFERRREEVIDYLALNMVDASNSRAVRLAASYCRGNNIPATSADISDVANEAIRRRTSTDITTVDTTVTDLGEVAAAVLGVAQDNVTDTAACSVANYFSTLTTTGAAVPTLADGVEGQIKKIQMIVDAGDAVLTPANLTGGTTITFADVGDVAELKFTGGSWVTIALYNIVDGATAPVLA